MLPQLVLLALAGLPSVTAASSFSSAGCYSLSSLKSYLTSQGDYTYQTNSYCEDLCDAAGYSVAGTLDGSTCYCGSSLPSDIDAVSSDKCSSTCNGYGSEICGGDGYLTINTNGEEDTSPAGTDSSSSVATSSSSKTSSASKSSSSTSSSSSSTSSSSSASKTTTASSSSSAAPSSSESTQASTTKESTTSSSSSGGATSVITSIVTASNSVQTTTQMTTESSFTSTSSSTSTSTADDSTNSKSLSKGAIAGIAVGAVVGVFLIFAVFIFFFIRSRRNNDNNEDHYSEKHTPPPVHNDMSPSQGEPGYGYNAGYNADDPFQSVPPIPFYATENGRKRLSNGSLPDARHEKTLRVTNPDETMNDTTLHDGDQSYSDDEDEFEKFRA